MSVASQEQESEELKNKSNVLKKIEKSERQKNTHDLEGKISIIKRRLYIFLPAGNTGIGKETVKVRLFIFANLVQTCHLLLPLHYPWTARTAEMP